jgi:hypothetical protein
MNSQLNFKGGYKMASIGEFSKSYEPQTTKNIADLKEVDVNLQLEDRKGNDSKGVEFKYKVIVVNGEDYRVPNSVLGNLKMIISRKPTLKKFSVARQGTTKDDTKYTVIPLD